MNTTLNKIRRFKPCRPSWPKLLEGLNKTKADDEPLSLITILNILDIEDAIWCLRTFDYLDYCLFIADVLESVLYIYEKNNTNQTLRNIINSIRDYKKGNITKKELEKAADAVDNDDGFVVVAFFADAADTDDADAVFFAAIDTVDAAAAADAVYAAAAAAATAYHATYHDAYHAASKEKWKEIEQLFIKHFGENHDKTT